MIRRQIALELGTVVPIIRLRDNIQLNPNQSAAHNKYHAESHKHKRIKRCNDTQSGDHRANQIKYFRHTDDHQ